MPSLAPASGWDVFGGTVQKTEDLTDHNIPLMLWYATGSRLNSLEPDVRAPNCRKKPNPNILTYTLQKDWRIENRASKNLLKQYQVN